jgi:hypothetical protein
MAIDYSISKNGSPWKSIIKPLIYIFALSLCETFGGSLSARTLGEQPLLAHASGRHRRPASPHSPNEPRARSPLRQPQDHVAELPERVKGRRLTAQSHNPIARIRALFTKPELVYFVVKLCSFTQGGCAVCARCSRGIMNNMVRTYRAQLFAVAAAAVGFGFASAASASLVTFDGTPSTSWTDGTFSTDLSGVFTMASMRSRQQAPITDTDRPARQFTLTVRSPLILFPWVNAVSATIILQPVSKSSC